MAMVWKGNVANRKGVIWLPAHLMGRCLKIAIWRGFTRGFPGSFSIPVRIPPRADSAHWVPRASFVMNR
jgi:hypothetical protein